MKNCYSCAHNGKGRKVCITCSAASKYEQKEKYSFSLDSLSEHARANYERLFVQFVPDADQRDKLVAFFAFLYGLSSRDKVIAIAWLGEGGRVTRRICRELGESFLYLSSAIKRIKLQEFLETLTKSESPKIAEISQKTPKNAEKTQGTVVRPRETESYALTQNK